MVNKIGKISCAASETKTDMASDIGGFAAVNIMVDNQVDISVNNNKNYLTYVPGQMYVLPGLVNDIYVKNGTSGYIQYWAFDQI